MGKFQKVKKIWNVMVTDWKTRYRLVFSNEQTHEQRFVLNQITIKKIVVVTVLVAFVLILITALLISLTPLRVYVPGYTTQKEYKLYKETAAKVDSLEKVLRNNQQYIDNFTTMLNGNVPSNEDMDRDAAATPTVHPTERDRKRVAETDNLEDESEMILGRISSNSGDNAGAPSIDEAKITSISLDPPSLGVITQAFSVSQSHYGVDIAGAKNSPVVAVADGVVIFAGFNIRDGNILIIQHPGNIISIYKHNASLLKRTGARIRAGEPVATMGNTGVSESRSVHLHFELWYNGFPINPLDYLVIE